MPYATGLNPSFDFQLFQLPNFGELFANEMGVSSRFNASDPIGYVNTSLDRLISLTQPAPYPSGLFNYVQGGNADLIPQQTSGQFERAISEYQRRTEEAIRKAVQREQAEMTYERAQDILKKNEILISGGSQQDVIDRAKELERDRYARERGGYDPTKELAGFPFGKLTKEQGYLVIAVIILVLLLLFVRR